MDGEAADDPTILRLPRAKSWSSTAGEPAPWTASGASAIAGPRCRRRARAPARRDHHARHRRGPYPHYLLKEISEAPGSLRKTLRGRIHEAGGRLTVALGADILPPGLRQRLADGGIRRIFVIGQGTAAVAGMSVAAAIAEALPRARLPVVALPATELSGFGLVDDMSDTLAVAISQSGTTTDTNRTVDLLRARTPGWSRSSIAATAT